MIAQATTTSASKPIRTTRRTLPGNLMRAAIIYRYGSPDELVMQNIPRPNRNEQQVTIQVYAAGVNPIDWRIRQGSLRWMLPARFPLVLGFDVAGKLIEVGTEAKKEGWKIGDEVIGFLDHRHGGGYAQYATCSADVIASKPRSLSFVEAAAIPLAASTALQGLRSAGTVSRDSEVLVNGASGGVGTFAVQLAVSKGAKVTGVCGESNLDFVESLQARDVINYEQEDFTRQDRKYDVVFDAVGKSSYLQCRKILKPGGCYLSTLPSASNIFSKMLTFATGQCSKTLLVRPDGDDLCQLAHEVDEGFLRPIIDDVYPLEAAAAAHKESQAGHVRGKLVLAIED